MLMTTGITTGMLSGIKICLDSVQEMLVNFQRRLIEKKKQEHFHSFISLGRCLVFFLNECHSMCRGNDNNKVIIGEDAEIQPALSP